MKKRIELSVEEASQALGVTPRSVINYIKTKEIEAIKVGKSWYVNQSSLEAFKQRYKLGANYQVKQDSGIEKSTENPDSERKEFPEKFARERKKANPVHTLRLFQMAKEVLRNINSRDFFADSRVDLHKKFLDLKTEALELLGAGFYSYDNKLKARLYDHSRAKVGGMLSLVYFYQSDLQNLPDVILKIESELMPAFSSLIRKLEIKSERPMKDHSRKHGQKQ